MKNPENGGSNELPVFEAHEQQLIEIKGLVAEADAKLVGHRKSLYDALGKLFELGRSLQKGEELENFVRTHGLEFGKVAQKSPYQPLVSLAFANSAATPSISKYATLLQYAEKEKPADASMADWIETAGGIEAIVVRARQSAMSEFDKRFEETTEEHMERARHVLAPRLLGSIETPAELVPPAEGTSSEYRRALVRHVDGKIEIVGIVDTSEAEVQQDVFRLVPAEAPLARRKLQDKPYYTLFRAAEIAGRFIRQIVEENTSAKVSIKDRYMPDAGLEIRRETNGRWIAQTISTQQSFVVVEAHLADQFDVLGAGPFLLTYGGIKRLIRDFPYSENWDVRKRLPPGSDGPDIPADGEVLLDDLPSDKAWRTLSPRAKTAATFALNQSRLLELSRWPSTYRDATRGTGAGGFPKQLQLSSEGGELSLSFPGHTKMGESDLAVLNSTRRELYELQHRQLAQLDKPVTTLNGQHGLRRLDLLSVAELSFDYGLSFDAEIKSVSDGMFLRLSTGQTEIRVSIPFTVALAGDYASIATPRP